MMFRSRPLFVHPRPGFALAAVFALGLAAGAFVGAEVPGRQVRAATAASIAPSVGPPEEAPLARGSHPAELLRVLDGDTFEARVHVWPGIDITTKVRLRGIDAPELRARCAEERTKAEAALEALRAVLAEGDIAVMRVGLDKYGGRVLADAATRRTPNVSAAMLAKGHARPYGGGRRDTWCEDQKSVISNQ
jgi:endonuclease YncB( thermonuclease family)